MADVQRVIEIDVKTSQQAVAAMRDIADNMKKMEQRFDDLTKAADKFGQRLVEIFSIRAVYSRIKDMTDQFDEMGKRAERVNVAVESLSALAYQAKFAGVSADQLEGAFEKLNLAIANIDKQSSAAGRALQALGVTSKDPFTAMKQLADAFAGMEASAKKNAFAADIFGKSLGDRLLPVLNQGADGMQRYREESDQLGKTMTGDAVKAAAEFNDNMTKLAATLDGFLKQQLLPIIKALRDLSDAFMGPGTQGASVWELFMGAFAPPSMESIQRVKDELKAIHDLMNEGGFERSWWDRLTGQDPGALRDLQDREKLLQGVLERMQKVFEQQQKIRAARAQRDAPGGTGVGPDRVDPAEQARIQREAERAAREAAQEAARREREELRAMREAAAERKRIAAEVEQFSAMGSQGPIDKLQAQLYRLAELEDAGRIGASAAAEARAKLTRELDRNTDAYGRLKASLADEADAEKKRLEDIAALDRMLDEKLAAGDYTFIDTYVKRLKQLDKTTKTAHGEAIDQWQRFGQQIEDTINGWASRATDAVSNFAHGVTNSFSDMVRDILLQMEKMAIQILVMEPIFKAFGSFIRGQMGGGGGFGTDYGYNARGNAFGPGGMLALADGGVVDRPTFFRYANGGGVMGEAGPEAVMPLKRTPTGQLGVQSSGSGVQVNVINNAGADVKVEEGRDARDGKRTLNIMVESAVRDAFKRGKFDSMMSSTYGVNRRGS
jgi:phage-related minor tail protein